MASTTATALIGSTHPNDSLICPTHLARLVEGDAAIWMLHRLDRPESTKTLRCDSPDHVVDDLLQLIEIEVLGSEHTAPSHHRQPRTRPRITEANRRPRFALSITVFPDSCLRRCVPRLEQLDDIDVDLSMPVWSRKWSPWTNSLSTDGELPTRAPV